MIMSRRIGNSIIRRLAIIIMSLTLALGCLTVSAFADEPTQEELLAQYYAALAAMSNDSSTAEAAKEQEKQIKKAAQDASVMAQIMALQAQYPEGMPWDESNVYKTINKGRGNLGVVSACQAFAYLIQDTIFPGKKVYFKDTGIMKKLFPAGGSFTVSLTYYPDTEDYGCWEIEGYNGDNPVINQSFEKYYSKLRPGDIICDPMHACVIISKDDNYVTVVEGNRGGKVHWGRRISKESLRRGLEYIETVYK